MRPSDNAQRGADALVRPAERTCSVCDWGFVALLPGRGRPGLHE
jgi:hypothetical protein